MPPKPPVCPSSGLRCGRLETICPPSASCAISPRSTSFPLAVFYLPEPPQDFAPLRDFRRLPDEPEKAPSLAHLAYHIRTAYERRELALELSGDLGEPPALPSQSDA